jgi:hypothetical protein
MEEIKAKVKELQEQTRAQAEQMKGQDDFHAEQIRRRDVKLDEVAFYIREMVAENRKLKGEMLIMEEEFGVNRKACNKSTQTEKYQQTEKYHNVSTQTENVVEDAENGDNLTWFLIP